MRNEYKPGQLCKAKITEYDPKNGIISISIKEVNPNPYIGAKHRHPPGNPRKAVVSGTYGGGVFCRIADGTTVLCSYSPERIKEGIFIGDTVKLVTNRFDDERMLVFGYIVAKW